MCAREASEHEMIIEQQGRRLARKVSAHLPSWASTTGSKWANNSGPDRTDQRRTNRRDQRRTRRCWGLRDNGPSLGPCRATRDHCDDRKPDCPKDGLLEGDFLHLNALVVNSQENGFQTLRRRRISKPVIPIASSDIEAGSGTFKAWRARPA